MGTGENPHFALMLCRKTPVGNGFKSAMRLLCARQARSDLPMSHAARMQVGKAASSRPQGDKPQAEAVRPTSKNQV